LSSNDRNDRDLRLIQGSALDRLLSDGTLRSRLGKLLGASDVEAQFTPSAKQKLIELDAKRDFYLTTSASAIREPGIFDQRGQSV
jgi:putative ATP-dependent endonuclease of OLD family